MALAHSPKIVTEGLVLCLDAEDLKSNSGSGISTLNNRALTNTNASIINGTSSSKIVSFDGTNDYINVNNSETNATLSPDVATFSIWCRPSHWSGTGNYASSLISRGNYNTAGGFFIHLKKSGNPNYPVAQATFSHSTTTSYTYNTAAYATLNGWDNWVNVTVTVDSNIKVYVDGVLQSTTSRNVSTIIYGTGNIGSGGDTNLRFCTTLSYAPTLDQGTDGYWRPYSGDFGSGHMYNRVLTEAEILQNYNALKSRFGL
jgi:hypothetical protein